MSTDSEDTEEIIEPVAALDGKAELVASVRGAARTNLAGALRRSRRTPR